MRRAVLLAMIVSAGGLWNAEPAQAFHHRMRTTCIAYYPGLYSYPSYCGAVYPPYTYACSYGYPKFCGHRKACWTGRLSCTRPNGPYGYSCGGCGWGCGDACGGGCSFVTGSGCYDGGCGGGDCGFGCDGGCYGGSCGDGCGGCGDGGCMGGCGGCGDGGCVGGCGGGDGGCVGCDTASSAPVGSDEKVLYDGPAPAPSPTEVPAPEADPSASTQRGAFRLTSTQGAAQQDGSGDFARGLRSYREGNMSAASEAFSSATSAEPTNALYQYYQALVTYNQYGADAANQSLAQAIDMERQAPVKNWGRMMERVQGPARLWIEQARREAGLRK
jgi:hypothetical protein